MNQPEGPLAIATVGMARTTEAMLGSQERLRRSRVLLDWSVAGLAEAGRRLERSRELVRRTVQTLAD
jgi:hypothetical protein